MPGFDVAALVEDAQTLQTSLSFLDVAIEENAEVAISMIAEGLRIVQLYEGFLTDRKVDPDAMLALQKRVANSEQRAYMRTRVLDLLGEMISQYDSSIDSTNAPENEITANGASLSLAGALVGPENRTDSLENYIGQPEAPSDYLNDRGALRRPLRAVEPSFSTVLAEEPFSRVNTNVAARLSAMGVSAPVYVRLVELSIRSFLATSRRNDTQALQALLMHCGSVADALEEPLSSGREQKLESLVDGLREIVAKLNEENQRLKLEISQAKANERGTSFWSTYKIELAKVSAVGTGGVAVIALAAVANMTGYVNIALGPEAAATVQECLLNFTTK